MEITPDRPPRPLSWYGVPFLISFLIAFSGFGIAWVLTVIVQDEQARHDLAMTWPVAPGHIVESKVVVEVRDAHTHTRTIVPKPGTVEVFRCAVRYTFSVAGREFTGDRLHLLRETAKQEVAEAEAAAWPVGREVEVHYNPHTPGDSCLILDEAPCLGLVWPIAIVMALLAFVPMLFLFVLFFSGKRGEAYFGPYLDSFERNRRTRRS